MELTLERSDLCQVGTISHLNTLALTEDKKSGRLRIVVGDDNGDVQAFEVKRGDAKSIFKTSAGKGGVQAICTGGGKVKDRVFCAVGQVVVGLGRKGKQFFSLQSSLVEPIRFLSVDEALLFTGGEYAHSRYRDGADDGFYQCPDRITAMHVQRFQDQHHVFLGCKDRRIRMVQRDELIGEISTERPASALTVREMSSRAYELIVGDEGGNVACYLCKMAGEENGPPSLNTKEAWSISGDAKVTCLACFDVTRDNQLDVVVGRADGLVQVIHFADGVPTVAWSQSLNEAIHSLRCGPVSSSSHDDVIVCTFAGRITSFSNEPMKVDVDAEASRAKEKIEILKRDVADLREKVQRAREKAQTSPSKASTMSKGFVPRGECSLDAERACYQISLELPVPIDLVHLRSSSSLDLLEDGADATAVVSTCEPDTRHDIQGKPPTKLLATFRCQDDQHALRFCVRTVEGEPGDLRCVVVARGQPKIGRVVDFRVPALSLHRRVHELTADQLARPKNILTLEGTFTSQNAHDWLRSCLPECPPRTQPRSSSPRPTLAKEEVKNDKASSQEEIPKDSLRYPRDDDDEFAEILKEAQACFPDAVREEAKEPEAKVETPPEPATPPPILDLQHRLCFENVYTEGVIECDYAENRARICSDSISALAILKEHISKEAVRLRQEVSDHLVLDEQSIPSFLKLIDPKLKYQRKLAERVELIDAIHEIATAEDDTRWLEEEYRYIHEHADELRKEHAKAPQALQYLTGVVADFFVDAMKARGIDGKPQLEKLDQLLLAASYDLEKLIAFFSPVKKVPSRDGLNSLGI